jgi:hypothetical protein
MDFKRVRQGETKLQKKGHGRLIHVSDFVEEENGRLIICNEKGAIVKDARCITYPGSGGDPWWDHTQLLAQVDRAIVIFEEAYPDCVALSIFDQSLAHASLGPDALCAFDMNKSNGRRQRKQKDTIIPINNPCAEFRGKLQRMTTNTGKAKGLKQVLEERGFEVHGMTAKCSPVCPFENNDCCMARLLSKQDDFRLQVSLLKQKIMAKGHMCIFLPKFHCELNPIEMVCLFFTPITSAKMSMHSTGVGASIGTGKSRNPILRWQERLYMSVLVHAQLRLSSGSSISLGGLWMLINQA